MIFKNTVKLIISNFSNVWKLLLYYLLWFVVTFLVCYFLLSPIIVKLTEAGVFAEIRNLINSTTIGTTLDVIATKLNGIVDEITQILKANVQFIPNYVFLGIMIFFIFPFLLGLSELAVGDCLYGYMTSHVNYGFMGRFIKNIGPSMLYSLMQTILGLVFNGCIFAFIYLITYLARSGNNWFLFLDAIIFALVIAFSALRHTLFSCWMPTIAVMDENVFKAFGHNFTVLRHNFGHIYSNMLITCLIAWIINFLFALLTVDISLIITVPLTAFAFIVVQMVSFFTVRGMRFYVYPDFFITPKTFAEQDTIRRLKYII